MRLKSLKLVGLSGAMLVGACSSGAPTTGTAPAVQVGELGPKALPVIGGGPIAAQTGLMATDSRTLPSGIVFVSSVTVGGVTTPGSWWTSDNIGNTGFGVSPPNGTVCRLDSAGSGRWRPVDDFGGELRPSWHHEGRGAARHHAQPGSAPPAASFSSSPTVTPTGRCSPRRVASSATSSRHALLRWAAWGTRSTQS